MAEVYQNSTEASVATIAVSAANVGLFEQLYTLRGREEVLRFIESHPFLLPLLLEAYNEIGNHFPRSQVFLEVATDPEAIVEDQLVLFVATDLPPDEAVDTLERFDRDWWLNALDQAQGKLCIDVELR